MRRTAIPLLIALSFAPAAGASDKKDARPNVLVFIADDVAWNDIGCYGHPRIRTPNLDKLAKDGLRFDAAFLTTSSCSPSRCSILTGRYPHSTGAPELHQPLPREQVTIAKLLKGAGYWTASVGKWHLGGQVRDQFDKVIDQGGGPSGCDKWLETLRDRPKDKPFFLWFAAIDAHRPYTEKILPKPHAPEDVVVPPFLPDVAETRRDLALYYDEITRLDGQIGEVLQELEKQGEAENTLVIFMADNGRAFPRCKTTLYDDGIRTPFVVRWPKRVKAGGLCKGLVSTVDLAPTLAEVAGLEASPTFQGKSFARLFREPDAAHRDHIIGEHNWHDYQAHERAVRTGQYLYIRNAFPELTGSPPADAVRSETYQAMIRLEEAGKLKAEQRGCFVKPRPAEELYDVRSDPFCLKNLAGDESKAETLKEMRATLKRWVKETNDKVPDKPTPDKFDRKTGMAVK